MYCLAPEKPLRLVYGTFYLAIGYIYYVFYTPTACGGVKGGDIIHHYGIRKNVA